MKTREWLSFETLKREVKEAGITSQRHYYKAYKSHSGWPFRPGQVYKSEWKGNDDFFGREK
ncbi:MAG: hypothetical protein AAB822_01395 [Patescibacteria group bacterium]